MGRNMIILIGFVIWIALILGCLNPGEKAVKPKEIEDVLVNAGIGITTFHSLNGDNYHGETPEASIAYYRWYWNDLEPTEDEYPFDLIDDFIDEAQNRGQKIAFRFMAAGATEADSGIKVPQWLLDLGINGVYYPAPDYESFIPDFTDPVFMNHAHDLMLDFGAKYNGHPAIDHIDVGWIGHWGEWHFTESEGYGSSMPDYTTKKQYLDWMMEAFPDTMLIAQVNDTDMLKYGTENGMGWRADCFGDMKDGWNHMDNMYPEHTQTAGAQDVWMNAPVAFETCGWVEHWLILGYDVDEIIDRGLNDFHMSVLNIKSRPIPDEWEDEFEYFQKKMGYRLVLKRLVHMKYASPGETISFHSKWENKGVAPPYLDYPVIYRMRDASDETVSEWESDANIMEWLPGEYEIDDSFQIPDTIDYGEYSIDVSIPATDDVIPAYIKLAIEGLREDGWYSISSIDISSASNE